MKKTVMKKLYSFRADTRLLDALREESDIRGVTVTDLMHEFLYDGLEKAGRKSALSREDVVLKSDVSVDCVNLLLKSFQTSGLNLDERIEKLRDELRDEIKVEFQKLTEILYSAERNRENITDSPVST